MNRELLDQVINCPRLPSLPTIALEVLELARQKDINFKQIAETISNDPALSSKILRTVNSSYYGLSKSVSTISHALVILGLNSVKTLALGFTLVGSLRNSSGDELDLSEFWKRSVFAAVGARTIARDLNMLEHEEAFLAGLLQDLGVMAMMQTLGAQYVDVFEQAPDHDRLHEVEEAALDLPHPEVGAALAEKWNLPPILVAPIRYHADPDAAPKKLRAMTRTVALGATAAEAFLGEDAEAAVERYVARANEWFEMDQNAAAQTLAATQEATKEMAQLFDLDAGPANDVGQILAQANEALLELSLETQMNATELEEQNRQLQEQATKDSLTGAAIRGCFNDYIRTHFEQAGKQTQPLSVIFMDADKFKAVNDTHGHLAGDQVLVSLAHTLTEETGDRGLVARYGGEEFALVMPNTARKAAAQFAEHLRQRIEATQIEAGEGLTLNVTVSMGVATYDGVRFFNRAEQLIKAADQAVYAAKESGRNCVRVFAPKPAQPKQPAPAG